MYSYFFVTLYVDLWALGIQRVLHANMDAQFNIESYIHCALKCWMSEDISGL
jgi:hypothetical protein